MTTAQPFAQWITTKRIRHGMTQKDLARALGVSVSVVSKWEQGKRTPRPLARVAIDTMLPDKRTTTKL